MKLALFTCSTLSEPRPLGPWAEGATSYVRTTEYVDVEFPPRAPADYVPEQIAAIDAQMVAATAKFAQGMAELRSQKANLLALTDQSVAA